MATEAKKSHTKEYLIIFAVLAFLTVLELFVPELKIAYSHKAISLTFLL